MVYSGVSRLSIEWLVILNRFLDGFLWGLGAGVGLLVVVLMCQVVSKL